MPTSPYIDGTGLLRNRSLAAGDGTTTTPDVAEFTPKYLNDAPITGATMPSGGLGVIGWLSGLYLRTPTLGANIAANATPVTLSSDGIFATVFGTTADSAASSDTGASSLMSFVKRISQSITSLVTAFTRPSIIFVAGTISVSGDNTILAAQGAGQCISITSLTIQNESSIATTILVKDGATTRSRFLAQSQGDGLSKDFSERRELKLTANTALIINLSGANSCNYSIGYFVGA